LYILIPLFFITGSLLGIGVIIYRKKQYLYKLTLLEAENTVGPINFNGPRFNLHDYGKEFFPEFSTFLTKVNFEQYKAIWLKEAEKILRRIRVAFLRVDSFSGNLIGRIRRVSINSQLNSSTDIEEEPSFIDKSVNTVVRKKIDTGIKSLEFLKNEEQRLIIEVAKNPKDTRLYEALGDLYIEMNNFVDAKESYEAAIELNPSNESLKVKLSSALERSKDSIKNKV
jgi:tetratricopeptide (TPR) repeat protein